MIISKSNIIITLIVYVILIPFLITRVISTETSILGIADLFRLRYWCILLAGVNLWNEPRNHKLQEHNYWVYLLFKDCLVSYSEVEPWILHYWQNPRDPDAGFKLTSLSEKHSRVSQRIHSFIHSFIYLLINSIIYSFLIAYFIDKNS